MSIARFPTGACAAARDRRTVTQDEAYWENLVKRGLCRFLLLSELAKGPVHGYQIARAIREACQGCCEPTEAMIYSTIKELSAGGYLECREEKQGSGHVRRVCRLTPAGEESFRAAARVWSKMLPRVQESVTQALARPVEAAGPI